MSTILYNPLCQPLRVLHALSLMTSAEPNCSTLLHSGSGGASHD